MKLDIHSHCTAFAKTKMIATGELKDVIPKVKNYLKTNSSEQLLIFNDEDSEPIEIDFEKSNREIIEEIKKTNSNNKTLTSGRPKLGVISREISLLQRHWDWLSKQPKGASATLRILVDEAKKATQPQEKIRQAQDSTYRFMTGIAGNFDKYEEALRALYKQDKQIFVDIISVWPKDIVNHIKKLTKNVFG